MTLRKCNFIFENYSERGPKVATNEIINKLLNYYFRSFYISTRITPGLLCTSLKIGLS